MDRGMTRRDVLLAGLVAVIWGINFVAIHVSLEHYPPLLLASLRFLVLAIPTILFVPRPRVRWRWLVGYGVGFGILQFAFLYLGMAAGMPAGLSSLVLQASAPFTVLLAAVFLRERPGPPVLIGVAVASGLAVIAGYRGLAVSVVPVVLVLARCSRSTSRPGGSTRPMSTSPRRSTWQAGCCRARSAISNSLMTMRRAWSAARATRRGTCSSSPSSPCHTGSAAVPSFAPPPPRSPGA